MNGTALEEIEFSTSNIGVTRTGMPVLSNEEMRLLRDQGAPEVDMLDDLLRQAKEATKELRDSKSEQNDSSSGLAYYDADLRNSEYKEDPQDIYNNLIEIFYTRKSLMKIGGMTDKNLIANERAKILGDAWPKFQREFETLYTRMSGLAFRMGIIASNMEDIDYSKYIQGGTDEHSRVVEVNSDLHMEFHGLAERFYQIMLYHYKVSPERLAEVCQSTDRFKYDKLAKKIVH